MDPVPSRSYHPAVDVLRILRWVVLHQLRKPWVWLVLGLALVAAPTTARLVGVGIAYRDLDESGALLELAFVAGLLGAMAGIGALGETEDALCRLGALRRAGAEAGAILLLALGAQACALLAAALGGGAAPLFADGAAWRLAVADLHLVALALLATRLPLPRALRPWSLALLGWVVPALLGGAAAWERGVRALFDASSHLAQAADGSHTLDGLPSAIAAATALGLTALLIGSPYPRKR